MSDNSRVSTPVVTPIALDDPWGHLETNEGISAVRQAANRLRRAGFSQPRDLVIDPSTHGRPARMFVRFWRGVVWVVLAAWDGSLAYRLPADHFDAADPFKVISPEDIPTDSPVEVHECVRQLRWVRIGLFPDVVDAILALPEPPGHAHCDRFHPD
ncbi:hypothetical protein GCM10012275_54360 [Longimycelium tulufanense]|uniref:Uncharacterized protein n=1 Tax=Longimycelium tulufanense TaxID=907463 RepID=A0A8J3CJN5_9PSEU|nr:hypothetical protein [Longimycelium tulufanense]GGM76819.1 hypothetical protein GCM10012275_54360 [Longimycelium tulufanense]